MKTLFEYVNIIKESVFDKDVVEKNIIDTKPSTPSDLLDIMGKYIKLAKPKKNDIIDFNWIDVSELDALPHFFESTVLRPYNFDVSKWDVSGVKNFTGAFKNLRNFNCDLSAWDVSSATHMGYMFEGCRSFDGEGLDNWQLQDDVFTTGMFKKSGVHRLPKWADKWTLK